LQKHKRKKYVVKHNGWLLNVQISKHRKSENVNEADRHILMRVIVRFVKCKLIQGHDKTACYNKKIEREISFSFSFLCIANSMQMHKHRLFFNSFTESSAHRCCAAFIKLHIQPLMCVCVWVSVWVCVCEWVCESNTQKFCMAWNFFQLI
jgi:hypothetical protein